MEHSRMKHLPTRHLRLKALAGMVLAVLFARAAAAEDVLQHVPANAIAVVKVNHLAQTNDKVVKWAEEMQLNKWVPETGDPLGALQEQLQVRQGLDTAGAMAFVFLDPETAGGNPDQSMLVLVPVSDYQAFLKNFKNVKTDGDVSHFKSPQGGDDVYVAQRGDYAAMGPNQEIVAAKADGLKLQGLVAREAEEKDVILLANIPAMREKALPELKQMREQILQQMEQNAGGEEEMEEGGAEIETEPQVDDADAGDTSSEADTSSETDASSETEEEPSDSGAAPQFRAAVQVEGEVVDAEDEVAADDEAEDATDDAGDESPDAKEDEAFEVEPAGGQLPEQWKPVAKAAVTTYFDLIERFLTDADAAAVSFNLNDEGFGVVMMADFNPDSELGKLAAGAKGTNEELIVGLPDRQYFIFGGAAADSEVFSRFMGDLLDPIAKELEGAGDEGKAFAEAVRSVGPGMAGVKSMSFGYPVPTGALGEDSVLQSVSVVRGDAAAVHEMHKKVLGATSQLMGLGGQVEGGPRMGFELKENARTVGGAKLDTYTYTIDVGGNPEAENMQMFMNMMYGPNGMSGVMGQVGPETFIVVQGGSEKLVADTVAAARKPQPGKLAASKGVQAVSKQLPANSLLVEYVALDEIVRTATRYAKEQNVPVDIRLPRELPPIGMSLATEESSMRFDVFVPTPLVRSLVAAGLEQWMKFQGQGDGDPDAP